MAYFIRIKLIYFIFAGVVRAVGLLRSNSVLAGVRRRDDPAIGIDESLGNGRKVDREIGNAVVPGTKRGEVDPERDVAGLGIGNRGILTCYQVGLKT